MTKLYWQGPLPDKDDFGQPYADVMYDAPTKHGPWANMTKLSWRHYRIYPTLGTGRGQKYKKTADGRWEKVEG